MMGEPWMGTGTTGGALAFHAMNVPWSWNNGGIRIGQKVGQLYATNGAMLVVSYNLLYFLVVTHDSG